MIATFHTSTQIKGRVGTVLIEQRRYQRAVRLERATSVYARRVGKRMASLVMQGQRFKGVITTSLFIDLARKYGVDELRIPEAVIHAVGIVGLRGMNQ